MASVGRFYTGHKGQDVLLEALSDPIWRQRNWKLRLFGSGEEKAYIESLIPYFGLSDHVEIGGHVPDVRAIWKNHHLMLMPSRVEGTPLALVEAMLCGRAALVTDIAGHLEWIDEGETGFVAEAPSAHSLHRALERAWENRQHWREMGLAAHEAAERNYDPHAGKTMLQIVKNAAQTPPTEARL
jgi:glycosyltransferase involved in cell wall biosynthesis